MTKLPDVTKELKLKVRSEALARVEASIEKMETFTLPPEPLVEPSLLQAESSNSTILSVKKLKPKQAKKRRKRRSSIVGGGSGRRGSVVGAGGGTGGRRSSIVGAGGATQRAAPGRRRSIMGTV